MSRIQKLFSEKKNNIVNVYCTAGYPKLDNTIEVLDALQRHGADMAEIGIPYSDPLADGPVIQQSNMTALSNGMSIARLFEQLRNARATRRSGNGHTVPPKDFPLILMGYLNPVLQYGFEQFCIDAKACGIDGLILPDLPLYEFENEYREHFQKYGLDFIFLITPETSVERIRKIDALSSGFIYAVSSSSTTGKNTDFTLHEKYFQKLQQLRLSNPVLVGFGIKDRETFRKACEFTNGAIIGSAYINALQSSNDIDGVTKKFLNEIIK